MSFRRPGTDNAPMEYLMTLNSIVIASDTWDINNVIPSKKDKVFYGRLTVLQNNSAC